MVLESRIFYLSSSIKSNSLSWLGLIATEFSTSATSHFGFHFLNFHHRLHGTIMTIKITLQIRSQKTSKNRGMHKERKRHRHQRKDNDFLIVRRCAESW